jgi:ribosome-binding ATPase
MNISLGIVGLPNVGKSTLFNTLTNKSIPAENYPFCTIDPNVGVVAVKDSRLVVMSEFVNPRSIVPAVVEFYDIAGLVRGAHKGEGLGNEFLGHIRMTNAIVHVLRIFSSDDILHVENRIDPESDKEIIETELTLKDLESLEKKIDKISKEVRSDKDKQKFLTFLEALYEFIGEGNMAYEFIYDESDKEIIQFRKNLFLLSDKKIIYLLNGDWENFEDVEIDKYRKEFKISEHFEIIPMNIKLEGEISELPESEREEFCKEMGIEVSGIDVLTETAYKALNLISFFTAGEQEVRAWSIYEGDDIVKAAGTIHTDFAEKFIKADVCAYEDFVKYRGWLGAREKGKVRQEGREYIVKDGDVVLFKHGA